MQEYAKGFYGSKAWHDCKAGYMSSRSYICERCGNPGVICHHKRYITPHNINNPYITLNWDNLECLCQECHNKEHMIKNTRLFFDDDGNVEGVKESPQIKDYLKDKQDIDKMLAKLKGTPPETRTDCPMEYRSGGHRKTSLKD